MKIAVLSGKGGTGKTFVSVNLSFAVDNSNYIDCDVEEPNGHLFFKPNIIKSEKVSNFIEQVNHRFNYNNDEVNTQMNSLIKLLT